MTGKERLARWAGMGNNSRGNDMRRHEKMPDDMTVQAVQEGDVVSLPVTEPVINESDAAQIELDQVKGERDQLLDRLARLQGEVDNAREREGKERADTRDYTISNTVEPFLGVMDNFQLALKAEGSVQQLRSGVELILKQMEEALKGLQVTPVETVGAQFDPRIHEALGSIETAEFPDHQVVEEIRRGYKIREKLLRPAMVKIAVNPAQVSE